MSKKQKPEVHSHHVQPTMAKGAAPTRAKLDGGNAGVNHGGTYVPGAKEDGFTGTVSGPVREPAIDRKAQEVEKLKLFQRNGSGNGDSIPRPGVSDRDFSSMPVDAPNQQEE